MFSILGSNVLKPTMARELPAYALAPTSMRVAGEPDLVLDAVERLYGLLGIVEKRKAFSVLASFERPDGMWDCNLDFHCLCSEI